MTVLVCGATGTTGSEVLRQLEATGAAIRAMTRNEASAARLRADGIEAVADDLATPDRLSVALEGVDSVYVATSASPQLAEHEGALARVTQLSSGVIRGPVIDASWSAWGVERMGELLRLSADEKATETSPDVERVTGRAPRSYLQFANHHADVFVAR